MKGTGRRVAAAAGVAVALSLGLCNCSGPTAPNGPASIAESSSEGLLPESAVSTPISSDPLQPAAGWLDGGKRFALTLVGSSCYLVPTAISAPTSRSIELTLEWTDLSLCTADIRPRTHIIRTPDGVDPSLEVEVTAVDPEVAVTLPPLPADRR